MTLNEFLRASYDWGDTHGVVVLLIVGLLFPLIGTVAAFVGKGGKTDTDGRFIASTVIGVAILFVLIAMAGILIGHSVYDRSLLEANVALLAAPPLCLIASLLGIRWVFPLNELASIRTLADMIVFALACAATVWFFSMFRGWGIVFFGSFLQLVAVVVLGAYFLRRLYRRAFRLTPSQSRTLGPY